MENNIVVYRHVRLDTNEVFYIGIGTEIRPYQSKGRNNWWKHIVDKTDYRVDILFNDLSWEEACEKEKEFIQLYGRKDLNIGTLVNMTDGGEGRLGQIFSQETRLKISKGKKGKKRKPISEEHKQKLSIAAKNRKPLSDETKQKMSKPKSEEHKLKISEGKKGKKRKPLSEEHKQKLSEALKGKIFSDETRLKISEAKKGKNRKNKS